MPNGTSQLLIASNEEKPDKGLHNGNLEKNSKKPHPSYKYFWGRGRYVVLALCVICFTGCRSNDITFAFTVICMNSNNSQPEAINFTPTDLSLSFAGTGAGAMLFALPAGWLLHRFGGRLVLGVSLLFSSLATILLPMAALSAQHTGISVAYFLFPLRCIQGFAVATVLPMVGSVSSAWSPVFEIGKFVAFLSVCSQVAQIFTMPVSAKLCVSHGWPYPFYFHGILSLIISIVFLIFFTNSPAKHPLIGEKELRLIMSEEKRKRTDPIPYREILRSPPVWAIWIAFLGNAFGFQLIVQFMPTFLNKVLHVPIERTGFSAMVPPLAQILIKTVAGVASDKIKCFSERNKLRLFNTAGMVGCGLCLVPLGYSPSDTSKATTFSLFFFTASISCLGLITCGSMKSATLVARQFAPFVMSVVQLVACIGMLLIPALVALLAPNDLLEEWRYVFNTVCVTLILSNIVFCLFCDSTPQIWTKLNHGDVPLVACTKNVAMSCRIDSSLQGVYRKQSGSLHIESLHGRDPVLITATSISDYGECYSKFGDSYVFGLKRMGRSICYRCVTPILLSRNVVHLAQQAGGICHADESSASMACFDANQVTLADGFLIFRSERRELSDCGFNGRFSVGYSLNNAKLACEQNSGTTANNCQSLSRIQISFHNCTFPDFDMNLNCIGTWKSQNNGLKFIIVENDESEEYRCGIITDNDKRHEFSILFSNDSSCAHLSEKHAYETYVFKYESQSRPFAPCHFADWLHGDYDSLTVRSESLEYHQTASNSGYSSSGGTSSSPIPIVSHCVHHYPDRIFVYSETKCGERIGYHCLQFMPRSENLMEFRTTIPMGSSNTGSNDSACMDDASFSNSPWTTALVDDPIAVSCGILGKYRTPQVAPYLNGDCYNVTFDCEIPSQMTITAYHCQSGTIFDSRTYTCVASWKDHQYLFIYITRETDPKSHSCYISTYHNGRLFLASTGSHCMRGYNFTLNSERTLILEEESGCGMNQQQQRLQIPNIAPAHSRKPAKTFIQTTESSLQTQIGGTTSSYETTTVPLNSTNDLSKANIVGDEGWAWTRNFGSKSGRSWFWLIPFLVAYSWFSVFR